MAVLAPYQVKSPMMNVMNSKAARRAREQLLGLTLFAIPQHRQSLSCRPGSAAQGLLQTPNRDILPETQCWEPEQDETEKCTGGTMKHQDYTVSRSLQLRVKEVTTNELF